MVDKSYTARNCPEICSNFSLEYTQKCFVDLCLEYLNGFSLLFSPQAIHFEFAIFCKIEGACLPFFYKPCRSQNRWRPLEADLPEPILLDAMEFMHRKITAERYSEKEREYIQKINELLSCYGNKFRMNEKGMIENVLSEEQQQLTSEILEKASETDKDKIERAIACLKNKEATQIDKEGAIGKLHFVIEPRQKKFKEHFPEEKNLVFNYVNNYGIRHNNKSQKQMKHEAELKFMIYLHLAVINFLYELEESDANHL